MQGEDFIAHDKGPGVAATFVLSALIKHLRASGHLSKQDIDLIFDDVEQRLAGDLNVLKDAREVLATMRAG